MSYRKWWFIPAAVSISVPVNASVSEHIRYMHRTDKYLKHLVPHVGNRDEELKLSSLIPSKLGGGGVTDSILASGNDRCTANVEKTMFLLAKPSVSFWLAMVCSG